MSKRWLEVRNLATNESDPVEFLIYEQIGQSWWDGSGVAAKEFAEQFNAVPAGRKISLRINSPGGAIADGLAIYNTIAKRRQDVTAFVDGYSLSAASFLMLAAGKVVAPSNAIVMIHKPQGWVDGDAKAMRQMADILDTHQDSIASIYAQKTGKDSKEINNALDAETWFTGDEAKAFGLVDEVTAATTINNSFDLKQFRNVPSALRPANAQQTDTPPANSATGTTISGAENGGTGNAQKHTEAPRNQGANERIIMNRDEMIALLKNRGVTVPENATDQWLKDEVAKLSNSATQQTQAQTQTAANATAPASVITLSTESITALADALRTGTSNSAPGAPPVNVTPKPSVVVIGDAYDKYKEMKNGAERLTHVTAAWSDIHRAVETRKIRNEGNTIATELTTSMLASTVITTLGSKLAALSALFVQVSPDPLKPKAVIELPIVTDGATTQKNPTDWESGDSVIDNVSVTVDEYGHSFHLTNAQLQSGTQVAWLVRKNAIKFADYLMGVILTPVTTANFGDAVLVAAPAAFGPSDLPAVRAAGKNFTMKNLVLDGDYFSRVIPVTRDMLDVSDGGGQFGFDSIQENNYWPAAVGNVRGFVASPESMAIVLGLPIEPPGFGTAFNSVDVATIPGLNVSVQTASWVKPGTRVQWQAFDVMAGVSKADTTALKLITTE
jgi:ATP-dependent Clp endopeptidase proteolytic subunit ClpP